MGMIELCIMQEYHFVFSLNYTEESKSASHGQKNAQFLSLLLAKQS